MEELPANILVRFSNVLVLSMGMMMLQIILFVRRVMQHALYVLMMRSHLVKGVTVDGGWSSQNVSNATKLALLAQVSQLMSVMALAQEISLKTLMSLAVLQHVQSASIKKLL